MLNKFKLTYSFIKSHPLGSIKPLKAIFNFIRWQLQSSLNKKLIIKPFIGSVKFYAKKGLTGITGNIYVGLHEFNDMGFLLHFLRKEDTFFDVGANVGSYTLLASGYVGAKSFAFEPVPSTFNILTLNVELNKLFNKVTLYNKALGGKKGHLKFSSTFDTINHVLAENESLNNSITVEVGILNEFKNHKPSLLKIDVEGFETEVIKGANNILTDKDTKAIIIELNGSGDRYGYNEKDIHNYLKEIGYLPYQYNPLNRTLSQISDFGSYNTIYINDLDFVKNRCVTARTVTVLGISF